MYDRVAKCVDVVALQDGSRLRNYGLGKPERADEVVIHLESLVAICAEAAAVCFGRRQCTLKGLGFRV